MFAGYFEEVPDIDVARIDISKNDVPGVEMKNYPMFVLYTAGEDGRRFITYEGRPELAVGDVEGREAQGWVKFMQDYRVRVSPQKVMEDMMDMNDVMEAVIPDDLCFVC